VRNKRHKLHLFCPLCAVSPFLLDVSLSSPVQITAILIFRFVSVDTASW
jgi:hypothetical protein